MATRLMLMPYLQDWDGTTLGFRLLATPQGSPLTPMMAGEPAFTDTNFSFEVRLISGLGAIPTLSTPFNAQTLTGAAPARATQICNALESTLPIDQTIAPLNPRAAGTRFLKYAPPGYRAATGYSGSRNPYLVTDDRYLCALKGETPKGTPIKADPPKLPWGKVLALALRQPLLAQAIGLVRVLELTPPAGFFGDGGWLYVTLTAGSPGSGLLATADGIKHYAARVPPLGGVARSLFTPVLFPVAALPPVAAYDVLFREAVEYDDGFAKAVYAQQPRQLDPLGESDDGSRPVNDHGVQLGWDDEQIATWLNRQIDPAFATQDAPMGVFGYRVDARKAGDTNWQSLVMGRTELTVDVIDLGSHTGEFQVEIAPNKLMGDTSGTFWVPSYYTSWTGPSLIAPDPIVAALRGLSPNAIVTGIEPGINLRYGESYEFRVRFVDHTGGGPLPDEKPRNPAPQPQAPLPFKRWLRPQAARIEAPPPVIPDPSAAPTTLRFRRPLLGYPACVFAGGSAADLIADIPSAQAQRRPAGVPDPDATHLEIEVQVEFPGAEGGFLTLYRTTRAFPAAPADPLDVSITWVDIADARTLAASPAGPISLPTSRNVRVAIAALAADRADYYGADDVRKGLVTPLALRKQAADERGLLRQSLADALQGIFLQPELVPDAPVALAQKMAGKGLAAPDNAIGRLADALDVEAYETGLRAKTPHRILFGCAAGLRAIVGPDGASVRFASVDDLTQIWLIAFRFDLNRDWSWDGLAYLSIERDGREVGRIEPRRTVGVETGPESQRDHSDMLFIDSIDPKPPSGQSPRELDASYQAVAKFRAPPTQSDPPMNLDLHLPITTPPSQVPRLAAVGIAFSDYRRDAQYSETEERRKMLWLEFDSPPSNPADGYFGRMLAYAPDPVLTRENPLLPEIAEPPLPIDPEAIRTIVPAQADDQAGLGAMQPLLPTSSPNHYLLPLPPGLSADSPELLGFFTYELRLGHRSGWSTAQGRFGRPLRVTGLQHPAPWLRCAVNRNKRGIEVNAGFADPVLAGNSLRPFPPVTQLWVLLYAQVHQADAADMRNLLLGGRQAPFRVQRWERKDRKPLADHGTAMWTNSEIASTLELLGLGPDTPLSCLAVETLPGDEPHQDPVGTALGYERFLRTSRLVPIPDVC